MLFFASSVSSADSSIEGSVIVAKKLPLQLLKWEECDTVGKKIGFVIGSAINWTVLTTDKIINKAVQIFHLDAAGRFCLRILKSIREGITSCVKKLWNAISPYFKRTTIRPVGPEKVQVRPEGFSSKITQFIINLLKKIHNFLSPIFSKIGGYAADGIRKCKPIADWIIVPLYNHVLTPAGTIIKDIFYGAFSGLLKKKEDESKTTEISTDSHPSAVSSDENDQEPEIVEESESSSHEEIEFEVDSDSDAEIEFEVDSDSDD